MFVTKTDTIGGKHYEVQKKLDKSTAKVVSTHASIQQILGSDVLFVRVGNSGKKQQGGNVTIGVVTDEEKRKLKNMAEELGGWEKDELDNII